MSIPASTFNIPYGGGSAWNATYLLNMKERNQRIEMFVNIRGRTAEEQNMTLIGWRGITRDSN